MILKTLDSYFRFQLSIAKGIDIAWDSHINGVCSLVPVMILSDLAIAGHRQYERNLAILEKQGRVES
jgi:hypothetical protein